MSPRARIAPGVVALGPAARPGRRAAFLLAAACALGACHWPWPAVSDAGSDDAGTDRRMVFAYYALGAPSYGATVEGMKREIAEAQALGIDGFALNATDWTSGASLDYVVRAQTMYEAARQTAAPFWLFMSADFCCGVGFDDARAMVERFASHPNQLRHDGRVVLSATDAPADAAGWSNLRAQLQGGGTGVFLVPSIFPFAAPPPNTEIVEQPTPAQAQDLFDRVHGFLDGYFYLGEAGTPGSIALVDQAFAALYAPTTQRFVAAITPSYWGALQASAHRRYFEFGGGAGAEAEWSGLIDTAQRAPSTTPPPWVEITTWNDFATDSHIAPTATPPTASGVPLQTHAGLAELYRYYIAWFKAGAPPAITSDEVVFAYRTQPFGATATMDTSDLRPQAAGGVAASDTLAVTTLLTAPAELRVYTGAGASAQSRTQPVGVSTVQVPFAPGPQRFELWRGGAQLVAADGAPIDAQPAHYNASVYSSFARAP